MTNKRHRPSTMTLLPDVIRTLTGPRITVQYPFAPMELPTEFRGRVTVDAELCRGCGLCVRDCPALALELDKESRDVYRLIYAVDRCAFCGQCEVSCPFGAIRLTNDLARPADNRGDMREVFAKDAEE